MRKKEDIHAVLRSLLMAAGLLAAICLVAGITLGIMALTERKGSLPEDGTQLSDPSNTSDVSGEEKGSGKNPDTSFPGDDPATPAVVGGSRQLTETIDFGQSYIDRIIFLGESTTAHLRSRGVLSGGKETKQVWSDKSNTMTLGLNILNQNIIYPPTGTEMTIAQAVALDRPQMMVLSFGLNGILAFQSRDGLYSSAYAKLIQAIHAASPSTVVILQTVYPVAENQTAFAGVSAAELNQYIAELNRQLETIAQENNAWIVDTASVLKDASGMLYAEDQVGDGIHLTAGAYDKILQYMRTHAYSE